MTITGRITKATLTAWLEANRPELALDEINGTKGFYRLTEGQSASFRGCGETWKDVAMTLEAVEPQDA